MFMKFKLFIFSLFAFVFGFSQQMQAVPALSRPATVQQPDGSLLDVYLRGDEWFHYQSTGDNYVVVKNEQGAWVYAEPANDASFVPGKVMAHSKMLRSASEKKYLATLSQEIQLEAGFTKQRAQRATAQSAPQKAFPINGSPRSLVILVNFSDKSFVSATPKADFDSLLNQVGYSRNGGTGSSRDYFMASSNGQFSPHFDIVGPYTLSHPYVYYGKNKVADGNDTLPQQMIRDACQQAYDNGVNFADYDTDNDGYVDNVSVYYAGYNEAEGTTVNQNTIWPHRFVVTADGKGNLILNGKKIKDYACTSELQGTVGNNMCGIGTFTHEFSHVLGLPDYYKTDNTPAPDNSPLGDWSLMDNGAYLNEGRTPPLYSVYDRFYLGWLTPEILSNPDVITLNPLDKEHKGYILALTAPNLQGKTPNPTEFFMIENRQLNDWDKYLPGHGMLVWHIAYNATAWSNNAPNNGDPMRVIINPANGNLKPLTTAAPFPGTTNVHSFYPVLWNNTNLNAPFTNITENNQQISFVFRGGGNTPFLSLSADSLVFGERKGETQSILLSTNKEWAVIKCPSWMDVSPSADSVGRMVNLTVKTSTIYPRRDTIVFKADTITRNLIIVQKVQAVSGSCGWKTNEQDSDDIVAYTIGKEQFTGHNASIGFLSFAEYFKNSSLLRVDSIGIDVFKAYAATPATSKITLQLYDDNEGFPGNILCSRDVLIKDLKAKKHNTLSLPNNVEISGNYYVGYQVYYDTPQDTFSCFIFERDDRPDSLATAFVYIEDDYYGDEWWSYNDVVDDPYNISLAVSAYTSCLSDSGQLATVTTQAASNILKTTAQLNASMTVNGTRPTVEEGFYYSTTPGFADGTGTKVIASTDSSVFFTVLTGLIPNTTYYYKAYALNFKGTAYGSIQSFKTIDRDTLIVSTSTVNFEKTEDSVDVVIAATTAWTATKTQSWLHISPDSATGNAVLKIVADANPGTVKRYDTIVIRLNSLVQKIAITQETTIPPVARFAIFSVDSLIFDMEDPAVQSIYVYADTIWAITTSDSWINVQPKIGNDTTKIFVVPGTDNVDTITRFGVLILQGGNKADTLFVFQKGKPTNIKGNLRESFVLYPNPVNDFLVIKQSSDVKIKQIDLLDIYGRKQQVSDANLQQNEISLDLRNFSKGFYIVQIHTNQGIVAYKILKQ